MGQIGQLNTSKPITNAMSEIREWLGKIKISGMLIDLRYDAPTNVASVKFKFNGKDYQFISKRQRNCRLNMFAIARVMEYKVRSHLMGIEDFEKSMIAYLELPNYSEFQEAKPMQDSVSEKDYMILGINSLASNDEVEKRFKTLAKTYHPDMALSEEAKKEFGNKMSEINMAYTNIKKSRGI